MFLFRFIKVLLFQIILIAPCQAQNKTVPFYTDQARQWADSVYESMDYYQRIGQLFMIAAYSNRDSAHSLFIDSMIQQYHIGGLIFFQGGPMRQAELTNRYQSISKVPLMIGIDGEWGLSMRLDSTIRFPRQMTLAAADDDSLIYFIGKDIARQCKRLGIHINFAPVVDINNNPSNPVINSRAFSDDKEVVARKGLMYMNGLQENGILACVKHFPGHGNTDSDSHYTLPVIKQSAIEIDTMELFPFKKLFNEGAASVMVAHLFIPSIDSTTDRASTLSPIIVNQLLKDSLEFKGLIFTDALNMKGVSSYYNPGELEHLAFVAGNDVLLFSENIPAAYTRIHYGIQNCEYEENELEKRVKKILMAKYWSGLNQYKPVSLDNLYQELSGDALHLSDRGFSSSVTVLKNDDVLPFSFQETSQIASLVINDSLYNVFQTTIERYGVSNFYALNRYSTDKEIITVRDQIRKFKRVIISVHNTSTAASNNYNIPSWLGQLMSIVSENCEITFVLLGNSYILEKIPNLNLISALVMGYEDTFIPQIKCAELIFGSEGSQGKLPVNTGKYFNRGEGLQLRVEVPRCLGRSNWTEQGISPDAEIKIDSIVHNAITQKAMPGCQVLVARNGKVLMEKSYGYHTYDQKRSVRNSDLYDIASITKIAATTLAIMKLYDENKIELNRKASRYYPLLKKLNKRNITIEQLLTHSSGLKSWIPFFQNTLKGGKPSYDLYHFYPDPNYTIRVCDSMYLLGSYTKTIWNQINESNMSEAGKYVYSDLSMLLLQRVIEEVTGETLDTFMIRNFYEPLQLDRLTFLPREKFGINEIVPTEIDTVFRKRLIHGDVHDPAAAMLGGVAGHAGLFSNAYSLAVLMQMIANKGSYGGIDLVKNETVELFTKRYHEAIVDNRRALGFDRPLDDRSKNGPTATDVSASTFGHTGFTGTAAWVDPEYNLVFIFLSNRVHPNSVHNLLAELNIRTEIQQVLYDCMRK